ncbi:MAG TPA: trehalose-phosphatase, partial [Bryobacteraceae bacterium]
IRLEDKGPVFSVHFRGAADGLIARAREAVADSLDGVGALRTILGMKVWEILPRDIGDKGSAVQHQLHLLPGDVLPIYAGDDRTDEPAFAALPQGLTIRVGRRALTHARYQLRNPAEMRIFLERLGDELAPSRWSR